MTIRTTKPSMIIHGSDSIKTIKNKVLLHLERSKEPLIITTITDSLKKQITINSRNSIAYYYNLGYNLGIGMLIERNNPKRYGYPLLIKINPSDTSTKVYRNYLAPQKGNLFLHISLPYINNFYLNPNNEGIKSNTGFWGITIGLDYFYGKSQFINISASAVSDFLFPVPGAIDFSGEYELMSSSYLSLSNNHKLKRFSFGYGISYGKNNWDFRYYDRFDPPPPTREPIKKSNCAYGLIFSSYYQVGRSFNFGVVYRPTFFRLKTHDNFKYEHLISIDLAWKIRLKQ